MRTFTQEEYNQLKQNLIGLTNEHSKLELKDVVQSDIDMLVELLTDFEINMVGYGFAEKPKREPIDINDLSNNDFKALSKEMIDYASAITEKVKGLVK